MNKKLLMPCLAVGASLFAGQFLTTNAVFADDVIIDPTPGYGYGLSSMPGSFAIYNPGDYENIFLSIQVEKGSDGKRTVTKNECKDKSDVCDSVKYDADKNVLTLTNLSKDPKSGDIRMLAIDNLGDLTIKVSGKNYFAISAMGTNMTFSGDGSLEEGTIFSDNGTIKFESGSYHLKAKKSEEDVSGPNLFVMFDGEDVPKELIKISPELEIKEEGVEIFYNLAEEDYFATSYLLKKGDNPNKMASDSHIAPKEKKQINIAPASTETEGEIEEKLEEKTEKETEEDTKKAPDTGLFPKELSATLASILGTVVVATVSAFLVAIAKKKSKKEINYY